MTTNKEILDECQARSGDVPDHLLAEGEPVTPENAAALAEFLGVSVGMVEAVDRLISIFFIRSRSNSRSCMIMPESRAPSPNTPVIAVVSRGITLVSLRKPKSSTQNSTIFYWRKNMIDTNKSFALMKPKSKPMTHYANLVNTNCATAQDIQMSDVQTIINGEYSGLQNVKEIGTQMTTFVSDIENLIHCGSYQEAYNKASELSALIANPDTVNRMLNRLDYTMGDISEAVRTQIARK